MRRIWNSGPICFIREIVALYFSAHVSRSAAQLAYCMLLTFFPFLICVSALVGAMRLEINLALETLSRFLPEGVAAIAADYVRYVTGNQSVAMLVAGILTLLFFASAAVRSLMNITEEMYGRGSFHGIRRMIASVVFAVLLMIAMYGSVVAVVTGNWFFRVLEEYFHLPALIRDWQWLRFVFLFALVLSVIILLYRFAAPRGTPAPPVLIGAVLASVVLAAASILFSWFIGMSSRYSLVYGSLASVIILLVWLYLCGNILILGNVFNCVWYRRRGKR